MRMTSTCWRTALWSPASSTPQLRHAAPLVPFGATEKIKNEEVPIISVLHRADNRPGDDWLVQVFGWLIPYIGETVSYFAVLAMFLNVMFVAAGAENSLFKRGHMGPLGIWTWMWTLAFGHHEDRTPTHGYAESREAAIGAFAKSWRRE
jgi:hypothetical protein